MAETVKTQIKRLCPEEGVHVYFSRTLLTEHSEQATRGQREPIENGLLAQVLEIPGIACAAVTPYALMVMKPPTFEWEEIEPFILKLMTAFNLPLSEVV